MEFLAPSFSSEKTRGAVCGVGRFTLGGDSVACVSLQARETLRTIYAIAVESHPIAMTLGTDGRDLGCVEKRMLADPTSDLVKQLTRIADALSRPSQSPWTEWAKALASFVAGIVLTYLSIALQARAGDKREQSKMRRIIYAELTRSFLGLYDMASGARAAKRPAGRPNSAGEIEFHPPTMRLINPPFTFEGQDYMRQHSSVSYELPEMVPLKRMYDDLGLLLPGKTVAIGDLEIPLVHFGKTFKKDAVIRENFRAFAGEDLGAIEAIADHFADHEVKIEDLVVFIEKQKAQSEPE
jgi:hypothetical protein